ncbi:MAG: rRNA pseudouridine synthase [Syntrophobacterales bacterium]|jgi:23S rRNA pseudouridine2605 synthase|nr:rRNA pseudouridine synthase [Syntrophobacterales bacterium]
MSPVLRLSVFLSRAGVSSRRKAEEIVASGKVKVNDLVVLEPQFKVIPEKDVVTLDNTKINETKIKLYIALHKPPKVLSDLKYDDDREIARNLIGIQGYLYPVGRLDYHSEGLMIFTNDGNFAYRVSHPRFEVEKEYLVKFKGTLSQHDLKQMKRGILIDGETYKVDSISFVKMSLHNSWYRIVLGEGKNRMIRNMGKALGCHVLKLKRIRIGNITLGSLKPREYRYLEGHEVKELQIKYF